MADMASKRRIRRSACIGKQQLSEQEAKARRAILSRKGECLNAYKCQFCKQWHVGHPPAKIQRKLAFKL